MDAVLKFNVGFDVSCSIALGKGDDKVALKGLSANIKSRGYEATSTETEALYPTVSFSYSVDEQALADLRALGRHMDGGLPYSLTIEYKRVDGTLDYKHEFTADGAELIPSGGDVGGVTDEIVGSVMFSTDSERLFV